MSYRLVVTKRVQLQLVKALDWYLENAPGHEKKLLKSLDKALRYVEQNPLICQIRYDDVRICFLDTYKFGVHYFIDDETIFVVGFFHHHQTDENWSLEQK